MASKTPAVATPEGLRARGAALWISLGQTLGTPAGTLALEACRITDRLDDLDRIIEGKGVLNLLQFRLKIDLADIMLESPDMNIKIEVGNVLAEARQQGLALKTILNELGVSKAGAPVKKPAVAKTGLDEIAARRQARS